MITQTTQEVLNSLNWFQNTQFILKFAEHGLYTTRNSSGQGITDLLFSASGNKHTISDFIIHDDNLNASDHLPLIWSIDVELKRIQLGWNFKLLRSSLDVKFEYASELEKQYLWIVEEISTHLVEILIQRQKSELSSFQWQQFAISEM